MTLYKQVPFYYCKVCFGFTLGSERNSLLGAPVSHASDSMCSFFLPHFSPPSSPFASRLSPIASLSTTGTRQLRTNHALSRPHSHPLFLFLSFSFLCSEYLGKNDQLLAAAARHQYALNTILSVFSSFLLTFLLHFYCTSATMTTPLLSYHRTRS